MAENKHFETLVKNTAIIADTLVRGQRLEPNREPPTQLVSLVGNEIGNPRLASRALWWAISKSANNLDFQKYQQFIDSVMSYKSGEAIEVRDKDGRHALDLSALSTVNSYQLLKIATQYWLLHQAPVLDVEALIPGKGPFDREGEASTDVHLTDEQLRALRTKYYETLYADGNHAVLKDSVLPYFSAIIANLGFVPDKDVATLPPLHYGILPARVMELLDGRGWAGADDQRHQQSLPESPDAVRTRPTDELRDRPAARTL
jgi:hypothetical protein